MSDDANSSIMISSTDDFFDWSHMNLRGTSETELIQVREGALDIVEGRTFSDEELLTPQEVSPAIVSRYFAELNHLSIDSTFTLSSLIQLPHPDGDVWDPEWYGSDESIFAEEDFEFQVIGIFDINEQLEPEDEHDFEGEMRMSSLSNTIHIPNITAETIQNFEREKIQEMIATLDNPDDAWLDLAEEEDVQVESVMMLNDPLEIEQFRAAAEPMLPEFWEISDLTDSFDDISSSMSTLQDIAGWVLWVSVGATLLILSLLITLFLRDRRYEMGVYLALGEKKTKIISQVLIEVVVTAFVGVTLAIFTGNIISGTMSRMMLQNELAVEQSDTFAGRGFVMGGGSSLDDMGFVQPELSIDQMLETFEISLDVQTIGLFYIVGLGAVILSTVVPVLYVVTLNPKKVLM
jgi:putative ABC transport system permease protein